MPIVWALCDVAALLAVCAVVGYVLYLVFGAVYWFQCWLEKFFS